MKPHHPYDLDKKCNYVDHLLPQNTKQQIEYYSYNYNCLLETLMSWDNKLKKNNSKKEKMIFIFGDHGWKFGDKVSDEIQKLNDIFYAHKVPDKCKLIDKPNSHVNIMRYVLKCLNILETNYLNDYQYILYDKNHAKSGKVYKFVNN